MDDLCKLFPTVMKNYITYQGSLTTPACNEVVTWIILGNTGNVTSSQVIMYMSTNTIREDEKVENVLKIFFRLCF